MRKELQRGPFSSIVRAIYLWLQGRIHFPQDRLGESVDEGEDFVASAENYWTSFPMKLMKRRAVPESLSYVIEAVEFDTATPARYPPWSHTVFSFILVTYVRL